ncbi:precorrin-6y C5,15-methyltransferase (decarboxylating) subunit CbiE [Ruminococcus callidus]|uniref:precorrin-6y C5,15-methyltransferase (decarboxylating) subunit CbiE n=1 Tax=Ruminococcus callidus TaxID=40519 RepID=UPI00352074B0
MRHKLILAGGGSGTAEYLLPAAKKALEEVELVIASPRFLELLHARKTMPMGHISELLESLPAMLERESIGIVVSGDPLLYSLCRTLRNRYPELEMQVIPGVGSLQLLGAAFGLTMEQAKICSIHGRAYHAGTIACTVSEHAETFFFCSRTQGPREIAAALLAYGLSDTEIFVGADLAYPTQKLWHGTPAQAAELDDPELCVAAVRNPAPKPVTRLGLLPDSAFLRNRSPMTKEEVRAVILSKLRLKPDAVVWDLGAGTGSVSIECARMCPFGEVYAVEYKPEALDILEQNKTRFQTENLQIVAGRAEEQVQHLPVPDCVFLGGSSGAAKQLVAGLRQLRQPVRLVASAVTMETQAELFPLLQELPQFEVVQLAVGCGKTVGNYHVLEGNHPVLLFSCMTKE